MAFVIKTHVDETYPVFHVDLTPYGFPSEEMFGAREEVPYVVSIQGLEHVVADIRCCCVHRNIQIRTSYLKCLTPHIGST